MNRELHNIASCFTLNKLSLNLKKTHFMIFKTKRKKLKETTEIEINGQIINQIKCTKFLGLNMDEELSRKNHIDQVATKISKMTGIMARARHHLPIQSLNVSILKVSLHYLDKHVPNKAKIEITMQKKNVRIMTFAKYQDESRPYFCLLILLR